MPPSLAKVSLHLVSNRKHCDSVFRVDALLDKRYVCESDRESRTSYRAPSGRQRWCARYPGRRSAAAAAPLCPGLVYFAPSGHANARGMTACPPPVRHGGPIGRAAEGGAGEGMVGEMATARAATNVAAWQGKTRRDRSGVGLFQFGNVGQQLLLVGKSREIEADHFVRS